MLETIFERRSIRKYKPAAVEKDKVETLLKVAMYAPSACNRQPWHFVVVDSRELLDRLCATHPHASMLKTAPLCIAVMGDTTLEMPGYYPVDCSAAVQNILLAAHELGLGTCWMGLTPRTERMDEITGIFNLPEYIKPFALVAVGYADEKPAQPDRYNEERVRFNKW